MNNLTISGLQILLSYILNLREQHSSTYQRVWFDTPLLRQPAWQSLQILPPAYADKLEAVADWMEQYVETYLNFLYLGPSPIDFDTIKDGTCVWPTLCNLSIENEMKRGINKIGIVLNLDKSSGGGSHWVAIFIDLKRKFIFYFESF